MDQTVILYYTKKYFNRLFLYIFFPLFLLYIAVFFFYFSLPNSLKFKLASKDFTDNLYDIFLSSTNTKDLVTTTHGSVILTPYVNIAKVNNTAFSSSISNLDFSYILSHNKELNASSVNILSRYNDKPFVKLGGYIDNKGFYVDSSDLIKDKMTLPLKFTNGFKFNLSDSDKNYILSSIYSLIFSNIPDNSFSSSYDINTGKYLISLTLSNLELSKLFKDVLTSIKNDKKLLDILQNNISNFNMLSEKTNISNILDEYILKLNYPTYLSNGIRISFNAETLNISSDNITFELLDSNNIKKSSTNISLEDDSNILIHNYSYTQKELTNTNNPSYTLSDSMRIKIRTEKENNLNVYTPDTSEYEKIQMATPEQQYLVIYSLNQKLESVRYKRLFIELY